MLVQDTKVQVNMANGLITSRRFLPYFCTQFLDAFNNNIYRNAFAILITYFLAKENQGVIVNIALMAFILPYFLFGSIAGQLADKYEKGVLIQRIKVAEIIIMVLGCIALYFQSVIAMLGILFALGVQSAFFGPIKYSILPQHVAPEEVMDANAYVEAGTFVAILLGTILGGALASDLDYQHALMASIVGFAVLGWFTSRKIPSAPPASPELKVSLNIWSSSIEIIKMTRRNNPVFLSILATSWFWFFGSVVLTQFPAFAKDVLGGDAGVATALLATFSIGIGLGSFCCSLFSGGKVEVGLVPLGALGITIFTWLLSSTNIQPGNELRTIWDVVVLPEAGFMIFNLIMIAFFSGLFIVPLYAYMQIRSDPKRRSRVIAVNNIINAMFMVVAGAMGAGLLFFDFTVLQIFKIVAVLNFIVTFYILTRIPEYFLRLVSWILMHSVYRIDKENLQSIPKEGPLLVVCNHVSFFDPAILLGVLPRPARFVMWYGIYELPVVGNLFRWLKTIPIGDRRHRPELVDEAFDSIAAELEDGNLVVIFPEGKITQTGELNKFQPGVEKIIKRTPVPVQPLALRGMWGTWTSRKRGRALKGLPSSFMKKLTIIAGDVMSPEKVDRLVLYNKVKELRGDDK